MRANQYQNWLDEIGVPEQHPIRDRADDFVEFVYNNQKVSGNAVSIEAGATYLAILLEGTTNTDFESFHLTQREMANITGVSESTVQRHYSSIIDEVDQLNRWP